MNHQSDQYYIHKVLKGEVQAFSELVKRYQSMVYTIAYRMIRNKEEAEEVAQDTFVKAYTSLSKYRGEAKFSTWLYTIAYRNSLDVIKIKKRMVSTEVLQEVSEADAGMVEDALSYLQDKERKKVISDGILQLPEEDAVIITLYYFEEKSIKEIKEIVGLTADNIKIKLYRSRKKLYSILKYHVLPEINTNNGRAI